MIKCIYVIKNIATSLANIIKSGVICIFDGIEVAPEPFVPIIGD